MAFRRAIGARVLGGLPRGIGSLKLQILCLSTPLRLKPIIMVSEVDGGTMRHAAGPDAPQRAAAGSSRGQLFLSSCAGGTVGKLSVSDLTSP